jgi:GNAT superfamily N-acetyltransferase
MRVREYALIRDYFDDERYMSSLNRLGREIFTLDCEDWYRQNLYYGRCRFLSYADGDEIVSNVSVSEMDLLVEGESRRGLQIGAVMTRAGHRGRGLSSGLIRAVLDECRDRYDLVYLFANETARDFYPRFGFRSARRAFPCCGRRGSSGSGPGAGGWTRTSRRTGTGSSGWPGDGGPSPGDSGS